MVDLTGIGAPKFAILADFPQPGFGRGKMRQRCVLMRHRTKSRVVRDLAISDAPLAPLTWPLALFDPCQVRK